MINSDAVDDPYRRFYGTYLVDSITVDTNDIFHNSDSVIIRMSKSGFRRLIEDLDDFRILEERVRKINRDSILAEQLKQLMVISELKND